jgi:hypothetical protein
MNMMTPGRIPWIAGSLLLTAALVFGAGACNGGGGEEDAAEDEPAADVEQDDAAQDPAADDGAPPDPVEDPAPDPVEDPADVQEDEPPADTAEDETAASPECEAAGGVCSGARWELCASGLEPLGSDPHSDCPMEGWCCVDAPAGSCSDESDYNCVEGTRCEDIDNEAWGNCWGTPDGTYECEDGRICCMDVCY